MFEKDLYALIRGLRNHKGNEKHYIDESIKECRKEIKGSDMDQKATALLKLIYLEMFGHDMSWASFNVLEVMSSAKYPQKRVGYLGAVQSFRPDTEVLMLAENLLKKDIMSPQITTISLALTTIPHVINPSMANSLLGDLLPRLSHSSPAIRKKTIVTLYRLALVFPETLRPAWPRMKERLSDEDEDPSVTAAIVNVVCELGWRRPQDFLPLAPRLFELLVNGGNNWMAIKIVKLFAVLTPLEPRLVRKLLPPLTTLIKTTTAMSLLYECINGILQGGILNGSEGSIESDEIAQLCVGKLRGMLVLQGDPNLKYVALLAMARIVNSHPTLVSQHADVILECLDDPDISIRTRALDLVEGMVDPTNLVPTVERLLRQLREAESSEHGVARYAKIHSAGIEPAAEPNDEDMEETLNEHEVREGSLPPLPDDYRVQVIHKILNLCGRDTYANVEDFEWYIGVLIELVRYSPASPDTEASSEGKQANVAEAIGAELRNVAVRVKAVRPEATAAAQSLLLIERRRDMLPSGSAAQSVLGPAAWIAGEYALLLPDPDGTLTALTHPTSTALPAPVLALYLQAILKVFIRLVAHRRESFSAARKAHTSLVIARAIHFLEQLVPHHNLEVQERAVEYLELIRLAAEATSSYSVADEDTYSEGPLFLAQAMPALVSGQDLNAVSASAIHKVAVNDELDLNAPLNDNLQALLAQADEDSDLGDLEDETYKLYHERPVAAVATKPVAAAEALDVPDVAASYQQGGGNKNMNASELARLKAERQARYQHDPFYIDSSRGSGTSTPTGDILRTTNGTGLDIESIPIMELQLDTRHVPSTKGGSTKHNVPATRKRFEVTADETLGGDDTPTVSVNVPQRGGKAARSLLQMDSSAIATLSLHDDDDPTDARSANAISQLDYERGQQEDEEMARAMREVERRRLEMQREQERVQGPEADTVVKRKKKKTARVARTEDDGGGQAGPAPQLDPEAPVVRKKKKKKAVAVGDGGSKEEAADETTKPKRGKKRVVPLDGDDPS